MKRPTLILFISLINLCTIAQHIRSNQSDFEPIIKKYDYQLEKSQSNIIFDSVISLSEFEEIKEVYTSDGLISSALLKTIYTGEPLNNSLYSYTYDSDGNQIALLLQHWSSLNNTWENVHIYINTYDSDNNLITEMDQSWENDIWVNEYMNTYTYNNDGFIQSKQYQKWQTDIWINEYLSEYVVDSFGNIIQETRYNWENNEWVLNVLYTYTFDENGNNLEYLWQLWRDNQWENYKLTTSTFDNNNNKLTHLVQDWEDNNWLNDFRNKYTYTNSGKRATWLNEVWFMANWDTASLYSYNYNSNDMPESILGKVWLSTIWENKQLFSYDPDGLLQNIIYQHKENNNWVNEEKLEYFNEPGYINSLAYEWNGTIWERNTYGTIIDIYSDGEILLSRTTGSVDLYYSTTTDIYDTQANLINQKVKCFPNPVCQDNITINIDKAFISNTISIELRSPSGQIVRKLDKDLNNNQGKMIINVNDLDSGIYLISLNNAKFSFTQKVIILN